MEVRSGISDYLMFWDIHPFIYQLDSSALESQCRFCAVLASRFLKESHVALGQNEVASKSRRLQLYMEHGLELKLGSYYLSIEGDDVYSSKRVLRMAIIPMAGKWSARIRFSTSADQSFNQNVKLPI
jgi:hypothetical protein